MTKIISFSYITTILKYMTLEHVLFGFVPIYASQNTHTYNYLV